MPSDDERTVHRIGRKFSRKRHSSGAGGGVTQSMLLPTRPNLSDTEDQADVCAPAPGKNVPFNMNQSFFQMLTGAASNMGMSSRFDDSGEDSDDDDTEPGGVSVTGITGEKGKSKATDRKSWVPAFSRLHSIEESDHVDESTEDAASEMASSKLGPAPFMSQLLEAQAQMNTTNLGLSAQQTEDDMFSKQDRDHNGASSSELAKKLKEIFDLPQTEQVVSEYPCWLLKSVLLQGYMYITTHHICFYAYLPKKTNVASKSGYLSKRGRSTIKFTRYWFVLKGDVLTYFADPAEHYFPTGHIDLRYGIQASLVEGGDPLAFTVQTDQRKYYFRADSAPSAKEWVKSLQKVIFRTHNEGDSVKISIPVANVMGVEESPVLDFADTIKLNVVDNDDTYAMDEYFFSFFSFGNDALKVLQQVVEGSVASKIPGCPSVASSVETTSALRESVRATLSPMSPPGSVRGSPRASGEYSRATFELGRRSGDLTRENLKLHSSKTTPQRHGEDYRRTHHSHQRMLSGDSLPTDISFGESSDVGRMFSDDEDNQSGSSILRRSDVFRSPTMKKPQDKSASDQEGLHGRSSSPGATIRIQPPSRKHTHDNRHATSPGGSDSELAGDSASRNSAKTGGYSLQRAAGWADWMKRRSKKLGTLVASQPMGYLEKVSDMWTGGKRHFKEPMGMMPDEKVADGSEDEDEDADALEHGERFRTRFALPETERLTAVYFGYLHRVLPLYGKIYLSNRSFCFRSMVPGTKTKMILPLKDIENVDKEKGFRFGYSGLVIVIRGHEEIFFEFGQADTRDDCCITLMHNIEDVRQLAESGFLTQEERQGAEAAMKEHQVLQDARKEDGAGHDIQLPTNCEESGISEAPPIVFDDPHGSILNFKPTEPMTITCLTIGSRGDVQPYIALCLGLMKDGHKTRIATHAEFKDWVESYGIEFRPVAGDPAELMQLCVEYGMFTVEFLKQTTSRMRGWLDGLLDSAWYACQGSDLLIESPSAMAGVHIAEALEIPYFRAFTMPWTRTRAYPHAFAVPEHKMGGAYNYFTYIIIDNVFWKATAGQVNKWRKKRLGLPSTNLDKLQINKIPFLYNFSPSVVIPPLDYSDWIRVTGYWFLESKSDWTPPSDLTAFIKKARDDGKKLVYVGFGSVTVADPEAMTRTVVGSVLKADVRCILSKGWSDRLSKGGPADAEVPIPPEIHQIESCPHDWLFRQVDAACHHGGAGTTGASLRAGIPTIIKPFFGDQFFFGSRVEDLGVGVCIKKLNTSVFSKALWEATHNEKMIVKAEVLGEQIRSQNGVETAIQAIYRDLEYARSLIKKSPAGDVPEDSEESWTFVGDESDVEHTKKIATQ
ncbi:hypothetical protein FN846DRAFT_1002396 [Sphaerosporella brunnea]|uniref:Sterol 3-beta-glucosyltransferase n=1 Tax=Sphaerosporella brunnea TaxID=1250544 RepID=A0A5J5EE84_9PEZI|nr:hypothetical protein FN846DRAFT_1002396 [Sphaerosporella brunnea]